MVFTQNLSLTWNTADPDFTECFHQTVLIWIPCGFLWLFSLYEIRQLLDSKNRDIPWSLQNISKFVANVLLIVLAFVDLGKAIYDSTHDIQVFDVSYVAPSVMAATFVSYDNKPN